MGQQGLPTRRPMVQEQAQQDHIDKIRSQFTRQAAAYADTAQARDIRSMARLVQLANPDSNALALDVACGPGRLTMALGQKVGRAVGLDATDALLQIARSETTALKLNNVSFEQGTATAMPFENDSFDIACCRAAFHHFDQPDKVMAEMTRVVKPNGQLLIIDILGNKDALMAQNHDHIEQLCDPTHVKAIPDSAFQQMFADNNLTVTRCRFGESNYDIDGWITHGGPDANVDADIRALFARNLQNDQTGLKIREENGQIMFSHQTVVYLLTV